MQLIDVAVSDRMIANINRKIRYTLKIGLDSFSIGKFADVTTFIRRLLNPFHDTALFPYPLKTSENQKFSDFFRGYRKKTVA